jgi:hypothetical protein
MVTLDVTIDATILGAKERELAVQGTLGSTILATTLATTIVTTALSILLLTEQPITPRIESEKKSTWLVGTASTVSKQISLQSHAEQSVALGWRQTLRDQLADVHQEASVRGWDGYDAEPITKLALDTARNLIDLMPETMPCPDIVPSPNGEIAFEWDRGNDYLFSIRTHGRLLVYAGLFGADRKQYGQEPIDQELPRPISTILATYFS